MKRVIIIVLDSVGIGSLPDANKYGDEGSNTIGNIYKTINNFKLENMEKMGLGNIDGVDCVKSSSNPWCSFGKMKEMSKGKDTTTGHWEMAGIILDKPFPLFYQGFPDRIINKFREKINMDVIGNYAASGTEIINDLGDKHLKTGDPIVYTSADSVFQIAAHEDIIPIKKLYNICEIARDILIGDDAVGRVIARPFIGTSGHYVRTNNRKDFSLKPFTDTMLDLLSKNQYEVKSVGKICDIFSNRGITDKIKINGNMDGVDKTIGYIRDLFSGLIFTNLIDFDMMYGHRNDVEGYGNALKEFDKRIPEIISELKEEDILIITADHGCDPTMPGTDHSREYVPIFVYSKSSKNGFNLGIRNSFSDIAKTVCEYFNIENGLAGESFIKNIY